MKKLLFASLILLSSFSFVGEPTKITWETLRDVSFKKKWNQTEAMFVLFPTFGEKVKALENKEVTIQGYIIPVDVAANLYVLSANPYSACFFCGGAGPESVVQLKMKKTNKKYETDDVMKFKGVLKLNADDINEMNYILDAAELIEK
jgi:hypothetical protein